jgi:choline dehydrogenase-like flavoprotein
MPIALARSAGGTGQSGPAVIYGDLVTGARSDTFELRSETLCTRIVMEGSRAEAVELVDIASGAVYRVAARCVIVAADALRTPQLLFSSGVRPAALGHHLNEHPYIDARIEMEDPWEAEAGVDDLTVYVASSGVTWVPFDGERFPVQAGISMRGTTLAVSLFLPQEISWDNRVEFSESAADWRGLPEMDIHYALSADDWRRVERGQDAMMAIAEAFGAPLAEAPAMLPSGTSLHYQGTVRMGPRDDGTSVCDRHSRVWGTDNVFAAGNGVIPTSTACNPTLTSVALAVLGAEEIVRRNVAREASRVRP